MATFMPGTCRLLGEDFRALSNTLRSLVSDFTGTDVQAVLRPVVMQAVINSHDEGLLSVLRGFGWQGNEFVCPRVDVAQLYNELSLYALERTEEILRSPCGIVFKARHRFTDDPALLHILPADFTSGVPAAVVRQVSAMRSLDHENIAAIRSVLTSELHSYVGVVVEYVGTTLKQYLTHHKHGLDYATIKQVIQPVLKGLNYAHLMSVPHYNLSPECILLDMDRGTVKMVGFGGSGASKVSLGEGRHLSYAAPERLVGGRKVDKAADVWSVGCIFAELLTGQPIFPETHQGSQVKEILRVLGHHNEDGAQLQQTPERHLAQVLGDVDEKALDLLSAMLQIDPRRRSNTRAALKHPFFSA